MEVFKISCFRYRVVVETGSLRIFRGVCFMDTAGE